MRKRTIALGLAAALLLAGGGWYASLDPETRGLLAAMPTNADVLSWSQDQRDAAFRALADTRVWFFSRLAERMPAGIGLGETVDRGLSGGGRHRGQK
mgnify:CR=1 FL=1